jgi:hypothetical protein
MVNRRPRQVGSKPARVDAEASWSKTPTRASDRKTEGARPDACSMAEAALQDDFSYGGLQPVRSTRPPFVQVESWRRLFWRATIAAFVGVP